MKLYLACSVDYHARLLRKNEIPNILVSYHYLQKSPNMVETVKNTPNLLLDSGAHTFHSDHAHVDYDAFFDSYLDFLKDNHKDYTAFVELDIEGLVGLKKVEEWRKLLIFIRGCWY